MNTSPIAMRGLLLIVLCCLVTLVGCEDTISGTDDEYQRGATANSAAKMSYPELIQVESDDDDDDDEDDDDDSEFSSGILLGLHDAELTANRLLKRYGLLSEYRLLKRYDGLIEMPYGIVAEFEGGFDDDIEDIEDFEELLEDILDDLEGDEDVIWMEPDVQLQEAMPDYATTLAQSQITPWNILRVGKASGDVSGVDVYLLDSGTYQGDLHVVEALDFVGSPETHAGLAHGYHIAGTLGALDNNTGVVGSAPGARIHSFRVLNNRGETSLSTVIAALDEVISRKNANPSRPVVVNMSFGGNVGATSYNALDQTVEAAVAAGIVVVIAAGNDGVDVSTVTPARVASAITVGSFGNEDAFSAFSNYGNLVDLLAPGENILSSVGIDGAGQIQFSPVSGTSMAAPHVTGAVVAYLQANPSATPEQVANALKAAAEPNITGTPSGTTTLAVRIE